jgi:hypothetical protein
MKSTEEMLLDLERAEEARLLAREQMYRVPRYSKEYNKLRWASFTTDERLRFKSECKTVPQIAKTYGYSAHQIYEIISEFRIPSQIFGMHSYKNGKPVLLYYPDDIAPYVVNIVSRKLIPLLLNKDGFKQALRCNLHALNEIRAIIAEIDEENEPCVLDVEENVP